MKRLHWIGLGAAAAMACAAALLIPRADARPLPVTCPQRWGDERGDGIPVAGGWVPGAADVDGVAESLVPGRPVSALICAYPGTNTNPGGERLAGSRVLTGQAPAMARDLAYLPVTGRDDVLGMCTQMGGSLTNYLIRFAYPDGQAVWVGSAEEVNSCVTTTNGTVTSPSYIGPSLTAAYRDGTWRLRTPDDPCRGTLGRRGQGERIVPEGATTVLVCRDGRNDEPPARREHGAQEARALAEALNDLGTEPGGGVCHGSPAYSYDLRFGYAEGPPARVLVRPGCAPGVDNGLLQADLDDDAREAVARLAPPA